MSRDRAEVSVHDVSDHDLDDADLDTLELNDLALNVVHLRARDVSKPAEPGSSADTVELGGAPRSAGLLLLGVAALATVASIVVISNRGDDRRTAPTPPSAVAGIRMPATMPAATPARTAVTTGPPAPQSALVDGATTCFEAQPGHGGTVSFGIRNRLAHAVVVQRVTFAPQRAIGVAATSIGIDHRSPSTCPAARDLRPAGQYRLPPGPVWISVRLTSTPACGTDLRSRWLITFADRGTVHRVGFVGADIALNCPPRSHFSHGRYG